MCGNARVDDAAKPQELHDVKDQFECYIVSQNVNIKIQTYIVLSKVLYSSH